MRSFVEKIKVLGWLHDPRIALLAKEVRTVVFQLFSQERLIQ